MKELGLIILLLLAIYLCFSAFLYLYQRRLLYFPVANDPEFEAQDISIENNGLQLRGWILNPGKSRALIYFGGNSELITHRRDYFEQVFSEGLTIDLHTGAEPLHLACLYLYDFTYRGGIRLEDGSASAHLGEVQAFNRALP